MALDLKLRLTLMGDDGDTTERVIEGSVGTWMCLADRVRFEHRFDASPAQMAAWEGLYDDEGKVREGADLSGIREEYLAFFAWCEARRRANDIPDYGEFLERVAGLDIELPKAPTKRAKQPAA